MKITLHIGPHKTATTSLQNALLRRFGADTPQPIWYPRPATFGPGHAEVSWDCLGRHGRTKSPDRLDAILRRAREGCDQMILSAEDFSSMYRFGGEVLARSLNGHDLQVIVTLSPVGRRAVSIWQEQVKHGYAGPLDGALKHIMGSVSLGVELFDYVVGLFPQARHDVIIVDPDNPSAVFGDFAKVADIDLPVPDTDLRLNPSLGRVEVEIIRTLNEWSERASQPAAETAAARGALLDLFASPAWRNSRPGLPLHLPESWIGPLAALSRRTIEALERLRADGRIRILGETGRLDDSANPKMVRS